MKVLLWQDGLSHVSKTNLEVWNKLIDQKKKYSTRLVVKFHVRFPDSSVVKTGDIK